jgi:hypothetical protein
MLPFCVGVGLVLALSGCGGAPGVPDPTAPPSESETPSATPTAEPTDEPTDDVDDPDESEEPTAPGISARFAYEKCRELTAAVFLGATTWASFEASYVAPDPSTAGNLRVYIETVSHPNSPDEPFDGAASCSIGGTEEVPIHDYYGGSIRFDPSVEANWQTGGED